MNKKSLGQRIKIARNNKRITSEKLAELLNISHVHMQNIEYGRNYPSVDLLYKIIDVLDCDPQFLFGYTSTSIMLPKEIQEIPNKNIEFLNVLLRTLYDIFVDKTKLSLGGQIKYYRNKSGYTAAQLAEKVSISAIHIRQIESNMSLPSMEVLDKLCDVLEVSPEYLIIGETKRTNSLALYRLLTSKPSQLSEDEYKMTLELAKMLIAQSK